MIRREEIRELAEFQTEREGECAITFYFQPRTPQNKSHREESILVKDLVRTALRETQKSGKNGGARADLERILDLATKLPGSQVQAKAVFACGARNLWREFDLPPRLPGTQLAVNRRFHLKPIALLLGAQPQLAVVLVDGHRARVFDLRLDELKEREGIFRPQSRRGRGDGFGGYDAGHAERRVQDEAMHHFKTVADRLKVEMEKGTWDKLIVGCLDSSWREFEPHLHPNVKQRLLGHFAAEVAGMSPEAVREKADQVLQGALERHRHDVVREALGQARSHGRGVTGLRRVLRSLELGEVQALLIGHNYNAHAVECTACGRIDSHMIPYCALCGRSTRELEDVCDAIIPLAIRRDIELLYVDDAELEQVGNIAALLRFRTDRSKGEQIAAAS